MTQCQTWLYAGTSEYPLCRKVRGADNQQETSFYSLSMKQQQSPKSESAPSHCVPKAQWKENTDGELAPPNEESRRRYEELLSVNRREAND